MFKKIIFLLITIFLPIQVFAQTTPPLEVTIGSDTRYDLITEEGTDIIVQDRIQQRIRIAFVYDVYGLFQIVALADTGPSYGNDWFELANFKNSPNQNPSLMFRRYYLQKKFGSNTVQLGVLPGIDEIGNAGLSSTGWVDGLAFKHALQNGDEIRGVVGSVTEPNNTNPITRNRSLNYAEIVISKKLFEEILNEIGSPISINSESGYNYFNNDHQIKEKISVDINIAGKKIVTLIANALYSIQQNAMNYDFGFKMDVLDTFLNQFKDYLKLELYYSHLDPKLHSRNSLYAVYFQDGSSLVIQLSGKIDRNGKFNWTLRRTYGIPNTNGSNLMKNRFNFGVSVLLNNKK